MGKYINVINGHHIGTTFLQKCDNLEIYGDAEEVAGDSFEEDLVCVVDNGHFAAAAWAYDEREYRVFKDGMGGRTSKWFTVPNAKDYIDKEHD